MLRRTIALLLLTFVLCTPTACGTVQNVQSAAAAPLDDYVTYTAQAGDTVSQIALRFHLTIEQLIALNADKYPSLARDPSSLRPGWQLRVPKPDQTSARATPETPHTDLSQVAVEIVGGINTARAEQGLYLLRSDVALTHIAGNRSQDMIARDYFSHYDPQTGQEPLLRYLQATGFAYHYAGENIAEMKNDSGWVPPWLTVAVRYSVTGLANEFVKGWLNSADHRLNIFSAHYRRTGVALAVSADGRRVVATQVFSD